MNSHKFIVIPESVADWIIRRGGAFFAHFLISLLLFFFTFFATIATILSPLFSLLLTEQGATAYREITQNREWLRQCDTLLHQREEQQ
ncbi:hypothetical protein KAH37_06930 [bacterium]|nr:hypothetical protein [bacterium]